MFPGRGTRRRAPMAAFLLASCLVVGAGAAPAAAWSNGACPTSSGVTVVVDFTALDDGVAIRCVPGAPSSGTAALADAGFAVMHVASMPGFVCRIDGRPGADAESCASTPPSNAYWSYWTAARGGAWAYSPAGPAGSRPSEGRVEGWSFTTSGRATPPTVAPPPPATAATPRPTAAPTARPVAPPTPAPTPRASMAVAPPSSTGGASIPPTPTASPSFHAPTPSATLSAGSETATPSAASEPRQAERDPGTGPIGTMAGVGLAVVVGGAAIAIKRRSRRAAGD
jgi:hypothetical protein